MIKITEQIHLRADTSSAMIPVGTCVPFNLLTAKDHIVSS